jgi:hypothetical protein
LVCIIRTTEAATLSGLKKRTYNLDGEVIERVRRALQAKTDTEAIHRALQKTLDDQELETAVDALLKAARFRTVYR